MSLISHGYRCLYFYSPLVLGARLPSLALKAFCLDHLSSRKQLFFAPLNELKGVSGAQRLNWGLGLSLCLQLPRQPLREAARVPPPGVFDSGLTACRRDYFVSSEKVAAHPLHRPPLPLVPLNQRRLRECIQALKSLPILQLPLGGRWILHG